MALAKYLEDNMELMYDRLYMQDAPLYRPETEAVHTETTTALTYTATNKTNPIWRNEK